jgi:hypothetical protein
VDPSRQAWLEKITSSLGAARHIDQREERRNVIFKAPSDGVDVTEGDRLSTDDHQPRVAVLPLLSS